MAYSLNPQFAGLMPITGIDTGVIPPNNFNTGSTTRVPSSPMQPGMIVSATDPTYGNGEFILLLGAASTVVGSLVKYNSTSYATTLTTMVPVQAVPVAVSMSANTTTTSWSWYQIEGLAVIKKAAVQATPLMTISLSTTAGRIKGTSTSGLQVVGARGANAGTVTSTTSTLTVLINRPHLQSQVT